MSAGVKIREAYPPAMMIDCNYAKTIECEFFEGRFDENNYCYGYCKATRTYLTRSHAGKCRQYYLTCPYRALGLRYNTKPAK